VYCRSVWLAQSLPNGVLQGDTIILIEGPSEAPGHALLASKLGLVSQGPGIVVADDDLLGGVEEVLRVKTLAYVSQSHFQAGLREYCCSCPSLHAR